MGCRLLIRNGGFDDLINRAGGPQAVVGDQMASGIAVRTSGGVWKDSV
jgi:hypothetical protein